MEPATYPVPSCRSTHYSESLTDNIIGPHLSHAWSPLGFFIVVIDMSSDLPPPSVSESISLSMVAEESGVWRRSLDWFP